MEPRKFKLKRGSGVYRVSQRENNWDADPGEWSSEVINQTFGGANPNAPKIDPYKAKFDAQLKNMQNPGKSSHKSFMFNDKQYIMETSLSLGENGLRGRIISNEGEILSVMNEFADINKAIMDENWQAASELLEAFESAGYTYGSGTVEAKKRKWAREHPEQTPNTSTSGPDIETQQRRTRANTSGSEKNTRKGKIKKIHNINRAKATAKKMKFKDASKGILYSVADSVMDNIDDTIDDMAKQTMKFTMPDGWVDKSARTIAGYTDEELEAFADGNLDLLEELKRQRTNAGEQVFKEDLANGKFKNTTGYNNVKNLKGDGQVEADPNLRYDYEQVELDKEGKLIKTGKKSVNKTGEELFNEVPNDLIDDLFGDFKLTPQRLMGMGTNAYFAIKDYKDARRQGHGVMSSAVRAGAQFAIGEVLGGWGQVAMLAAQAPKAAIKGAELLYKENRRMNSAANHQTFGDASFQDTQQLATMRQSGMEMAKMAQYNLQQTLMGNEATFLHR